MNARMPLMLPAFLLLMAFFAGCESGSRDQKAEAPPPLQLERVDPNIFQVEHPDQFPLIAAGEHIAVSQLRVTGTVNPDISRNVPVISLATGRIVEIKARLGDTVTKGQLMLRVQSPDIANAFSNYRQAVADETLAKAQLERSKMLYDKGAIAQKDLEVAVDTEDKAKVTLETAVHQLRVLGVADLEHPDPILNITAPASGVITDQQVTTASGTQGLASPNAFTISDLTYVWILCDVYENNLPMVRLGDKADIRLNAYPEQVFTGTISNIGSILDPNLRTAKVRIEVRNPGLMRPGMFATATFYGRQKERYAAVPAPAVLHLHDRDWVYVPAGGNKFRRVEVKAGEMLAGHLQTILSGITPGQSVVANGLEFQNTVEQ